MADTAPFGAFIRDLSNAVGYQFEFVCIRCGNGYRSSFIAASALAADAGGYAVGKVAGKIPFIGGLVGDTASDMVKDRVKDAALNRAYAEVGPAFAQCPRCGRWRCRAVCWNPAVNLCVDCAPRTQAAMPPPAYAAPPPSSPYALPPPSAPVYAVPPLGGYGNAATGAPPQYPPPAYAPQYPAPQYPPAAYPPPAYQAAGYPPPAYGVPPYAPAYINPPRNSGTAVVSLLCGLFTVGWVITSIAFASQYQQGQFNPTGYACTFGFLSALAAIICGHVALGQIKRSRGALSGGGMAVTGLVLGYTFIGLTLLIVVFAFSAVAAINHSAH